MASRIRDGGRPPTPPFEVLLHPPGLEVLLEVPTARRPCTMPGCTNLSNTDGRCGQHQAAADRLKGTAAQRGYSGQHVTRFRRQVLTASPWCVCGKKATVADHYPRTRKQLVKAGLDPDDPQYGRGLCAACHNRHSGLTTPGGAVGNR